MRAVEQPHLWPAFSSLPIELFLNVLDQLVGTRDGRQPIAYAPSDPITKALRALTLVSKGLYPATSGYLYTHCLYLHTSTNFSRFRRTLGFDRGYGRHPDALQDGQPSRHERLFMDANLLSHITSLFISPQKTNECGSPKVWLSQVIDLCNTVGPTLKRLAMDLGPVYSPRSSVQRINPHVRANNIFSTMLNLEELVCSYEITEYFPYPPPNLKRLAITSQKADKAFMKFCFSIPTLETLFFLRQSELEAFHIQALFDHFIGRHLNVVLIDISSNHQTPESTRDWMPEDRVVIYEADVPKSYYGDEDDLVLCDDWVWTNAVNGTLWNQERRRMRSWSEVKAILGS
ncbi:uncharacterized protein BDR25DRAFT_380169 [Lindgomyces ingoldianus]|uniref:Uncharacterized protein n=1 Tax=Lindgomyces ingoldianus TaxID=673940 RepID=A0ACB6QG57_9PLEO|nr:uncharacterized protein BDR25DRAFT_380169 [Lindgomyces ingoldianus]KAF2465097.1 hypothetical protein BDR25DRAFT_380169 [Lindgomyces ingoldianus]